MTFDNRTTELIALGAAVAANCRSCVEHHGRKAAEYGIDAGEVAQAIEIGRAVRKGAAANVDQVADGLARTRASAASGASSAGVPAGDAGCCGGAPKEAGASTESGASTCFPNRCAPFSSMMHVWRSGGSPFPGWPTAKS